MGVSRLFRRPDGLPLPADRFHDPVLIRRVPDAGAADHGPDPPLVRGATRQSPAPAGGGEYGHRRSRRIGPGHDHRNDGRIRAGSGRDPLSERHPDRLHPADHGARRADRRCPADLLRASRRSAALAPDRDRRPTRGHGSVRRAHRGLAAYMGSTVRSSGRPPISAPPRDRPSATSSCPSSRRRSWPAP